MSKAWELYNDSYIKGIKRPDYWGFKPDQASGASMLFRSEETNPWANRDRSNAKFGSMGGANNNSVIRGPGGGGSGLNMGQMPLASPGGGGGNQSTLTGLAKMGGGMLAQKGMKYGMNKGADYLSDLWNYEAIPDAASEAYLQGGTTGMESLLEGGGGAAEAYLDGGTAGLESAAESGMDAAGGASSAIPFIGAGAKLGMGAATGKLQKHPGSTVGSAAGGAIGGAVGSIFGPVGTVVGGMAGSEIGGKVGGFIEKPSLKSGMNVIKPPDTNPTEMISKVFSGGLFGGGGGGAAPTMPVPEAKLSDLVKTSGEGEGTRIVDSEYNDLWAQLMGLQDTGDYGNIDDYLSQDWSMWE